MIKTSKVANEVVILSIGSQHFNNFFLYFLDVNNRIPPTQVETVLTKPNDALTGIPTTVNAVPIVEIPLIMPTELVPVDACSNLFIFLDIDLIDRDEIGEEADKWGDGLINDLRNRLDELRRFNATLETSSDKDITLDKNKLKKGTIKLVEDEIYDKMTNLFNNKNYDSFDLDDNGNLTFTYENKVTGLGNIAALVFGNKILIYLRYLYLGYLYLRYLYLRYLCLRYLYLRYLYLRYLYLRYLYLRYSYPGYHIWDIISMKLLFQI